MLNCAPQDSSFILYTLLFNSRRWYWWYLTVETVEVSCGALLRRVYLWIHPKKNKNNFSHLKINCEKNPERTLWERVGYTTQQLCLNHKAEEVFFPISWIFLCLPLHTGSLFLSLSVAGWVTALCCWSQATGLHLQLSRLHGFKRAGRSHGRFWTASMSSHVIHEHKVNTAQWSILLQKTQRND